MTVPKSIHSFVASQSAATVNPQTNNMFKIFAIVLLAVIAVTTAKPSPQLLAAYSSPLVGSAPGAFAPYATAVASQEFHGASPFYSAAYAAPYVAAPAAYSAAYSAYPYVL